MEKKKLYRKRCIMNVTVSFDSESYSGRLNKLRIKLSDLGNPTSIYYAGASCETIKRAFKTGKIKPQLLHNIDKILEYFSNPKYTQYPSIPYIMQLLDREKILENDIELLRKNSSATIKCLENELSKLATDLNAFGDNLKHASSYLNYVLGKTK